MYPISSRAFLSLSILFGLVGFSNTMSAQCGTVAHIEPPTQVFCNAPGSSVTLTAQPLGGVFTGQGIRGDGFLALDKLASGSYWMYYTAADSCATKDSVELNIQQVTSDLTQLNPYNCADNRPSLLQVVATSDETLLIEGFNWAMNVQPGEFETRSIPNARPYRLEVNSATGQSCISNVQPDFINPPQVWTRTNLDCLADTINIEVVGQFLPHVATWKYYDDFAFAKTGEVETGLQLSPKQVGDYQLEVKYPNGCTSEKAVWVPLIDSFIPEVTLPARVLMPCIAEEVVLPCLITAAEENGQPYVSWVSESGQGLVDSTSMAPTVNWVGTYTVFVIDSTSGCSAKPRSIRVDQAGPQQDTFYQSICHDSFYDWEGRRHRESGVFDRSFENYYGCDSNRVLVLEVLAKAEDTISMTSCAGSTVMFGTDILQTAGLYTQTFSSIRGCDSTVTLFLEFASQEVSALSQTICAGEDYQLAGQTFTESGFYAVSFQTSTGCDSIVELTLQVLPQNQSATAVEICEGDTYLFGNQPLFIAGQYVDTLTTNTGCDSIVSLRLEVLPTSNTDLSAVICEGEAYEFLGQSVTRTGLYSLAFGAANGCDSLFNLDLTVTPSMELSIDTVNRGGTNVFDLVIRVEGGVAPYRFQWSNGANSDKVTLGADVTSVEVFDANGCGQVLVLGGSSNTSPDWANDLNLGPNPTKGALQWSYPTGTALELVRVFNMQGQVIATQSLVGRSVGQYSLADHPAGVYLFEFIDVQGQRHAQRVVSE